MYIWHTACIAHSLINFCAKCCSQVSCASIKDHVYIQLLCCAHVCAGSGSRQEYTSPPNAAAPNIRGSHPAGNIDYGIYVICTLCVHVNGYVCLHVHLSRAIIKHCVVPSIPSTML